MRVLMTTDTVGGVWTFSRQLATEFLKRGHDVALVSFGRSPSASQREWCDGTTQSFPGCFCYVPSDAPLEWMADNERAYSEGAPLLLSVASEFTPDVLLTSQFCFAAVPLVIPKVVVAHSDVLSWARACRGGDLEPTLWLQRYIALASAGLRAATAIVAPTHWMLSALGAGFSLERPARVIPNGLSIDKAAEQASKKHQAVSAGRFWDEAKNLPLLRRAKLPLPVLVAGDCEGFSAGASAEASGLTLLGELSEGRLHDLLSESDIYLCTSIYEPFGLAPLEAALCGCAVVANDIPSLREVWGDSAIFFRDAVSLESSLARLEDPVLLRDAQERSLKRARLFSGDRMAKQYLDLLGDLVEGIQSECRSSANAA